MTLSFADADELVRMLTGSVDAGLRMDVAGELCNMIAGGWLERRLAVRERLTMQPPRIVLAGDVGRESNWPLSFVGVYSFGRGSFRVRLLCAEIH